MKTLLFIDATIRPEEESGAIWEQIMAQAEMKIRSLVREQQKAEEMKPSDDNTKNGGEIR